MQNPASRNAILLHGLPSRQEYYDPAQPSLSNAHWFPWLQKQLIINDIKTDAPEIPHSYAPVWSTWLREVERFDIGPHTTLVGHSMGGGFWLRYLMEHPDVRIDKLVLVAPWMDIDRQADIKFLPFELDGRIVGQANHVVIFASDNDDPDIRKGIDHIEKALPGAKIKTFHNYGHFCYEDMHTDAFPELFAAII